MRQCLIFIGILTIIFFNCKDQSKNPVKDISTGQLISLDHNDTNFCCGRPYDTVLKSGWKVQYLVKDDSTKYKDIYIRWSKENKSGLYFGEDLQEFRTYFVPEFVAENQHYIFMEHACATSCAGLLALSKQTLIERDFLQIKTYDINTNQIIWLPEEDFKNESIFKVTLTDLNKNKDTTIAFKNLALGSFKESYIDTVLFSKHLVTIKCKLIDETDDTRKREVIEIQSIRL